MDCTVTGKGYDNNSIKLTFNNKRSAETHFPQQEVRYLPRRLLVEHKDWCLSVMLRDLFHQSNSSNTLTSANMSLDNHSYIDITELEADGIIELDVFDTIINNISNENYWTLPLDVLDIFGAQGIITSRAYNTFSPNCDFAEILPEQLTLMCRIAEFELDSKQHTINFGDPKYYRMAYEYLRCNPNIASYQIITLDNSTIIFINGIPMEVHVHIYRTCLDQSSLSERFSAVDNLLNPKQIQRDSIITIDLAYLLPENVNICRTFDREITMIQYGNTDNYYYPDKLKERERLWSHVEDYCCSRNKHNSFDGFTSGYYYSSNVKFIYPDNNVVPTYNYNYNKINNYSNTYKLRIGRLDAEISCGYVKLI